jgi:hypothetical protein
MNIEEMKCKNCPHGGNCDVGSLRSQDNYWGFVDNEHDVKFVPCPPTYCTTDTYHIHHIVNVSRVFVVVIMKDPLSHTTHHIAYSLPHTLYLAPNDTYKVWKWVKWLKKGVFLKVFEGSNSKYI